MSGINKNNSIVNHLIVMYHKDPIRNAALSAQADKQARQANRRISRWINPIPVARSVNPAEIGEENAGRYSRKCRFIKVDHLTYYTSCIVWKDGGTIALYKSGFLPNIFKRKLVAPAGMKWESKDGACLVRQSDGMEYHPTAEDMIAKDFASRVRKNMAENYRRRLAIRKSEKEAKKNAKEAARVAAIEAREIKSTRVTMQDSRNAGNCVEGTLQYVEKRLGIESEQVIAGLWLFSVPARVISSDKRAQAAAHMAFLRESLVAI